MTQHFLFRNFFLVFIFAAFDISGANILFCLTWKSESQTIEVERKLTVNLLRAMYAHTHMHDKECRHTGIRWLRLKSNFPKAVQKWNANAQWWVDFSTCYGHHNLRAEVFVTHTHTCLYDRIARWMTVEFVFLQFIFPRIIFDVCVGVYGGCNTHNRILSSFSFFIFIFLLVFLVKSFHFFTWLLILHTFNLFTLLRQFYSQIIFFLESCNEEQHAKMVKMPNAHKTEHAVNSVCRQSSIHLCTGTYTC